MQTVEQAEWTVPGAYAGPPCQREDVTDEDGGPLWFVSIECNQGWAEVAEVCGGTPAEATARAQAIVRALHGGTIAGEAVNHIERLYRSDNEDDWLAAELLSRLTAEQAKDAEIERLREVLARIAYEEPSDPWRLAHDALKLSARPLAKQPQEAQDE